MENYTFKSFSWWNLTISKFWMWILGAIFIPNWEKVTSTPGERSGECRFTFLIKFVKLKNSSWVSDAGSFCWLEIPCKFSKGSCPLEDKFEFWPFLLLFLTFLQVQTCCAAIGMYFTSIRSCKYGHEVQVIWVLVQVWKKESPLIIYYTRVFY